MDSRPTINDKRPSIVFLSGNAGKIAEVQSIASTLGFEVKGVKIPDMPEEIQGSFEKIIQKKIVDAVEIGKKHDLIHAGDIVLTEDSGVEIDMFGNMPGPYTKHFFETPGEGISYDDFVKLFEGRKIEGLCVTVAACLPDIEKPESCLFTRGTMRGYFVSKRGTNGFGWDPYFVPTSCEDHPINPEGKTLGEMTMEEKSGISMRKVAIEKILHKLS